MPTLKLHPCPFCGGEAERVDIDPMQEEYANAGGSCIQCKQCQASSAVHGDRKENLISSWNARVPQIKPSIPTCCVTGAIPGDGGACGDCDPCIYGEALVPEAVKRLIAEKNSLIQRNGELEDAQAWQPIETAPKDSKDILLCRTGIGEVVRIGFWDLPRGGVWSKWPGREPMDPTHWMPLPFPPAE